MAKLAIVGTGFVGTSLALALRPSKMFTSIAGWDVERGRLQAAKRAGAVDDEARSAAAAVDQAAVVVVTVPGTELEAVFDAISPALSAGAVVTDTGHWKLLGEAAARALPPDVHYIGGRPVLDRTGYEPQQPSAEVLRNAVYCLTPRPTTSELAINTMTALVTATGAQPYFLDPAEHDGLTAATELLPRALVASLTLTLTGSSSWGEAGKLAGDSFNRLALLAEELDPRFWQDATQNRASVSHWLEVAAASLLQLRDRLDAGRQLDTEWEAALEALAHWRRDKRQLQESTMPPKSELRPNLLGSLTSLSRRNRNIKASR